MQLKYPFDKKRTYGNNFVTCYLHKNGINFVFLTKDGGKSTNLLMKQIHCVVSITFFLLKCLEYKAVCNKVLKSLK